MKDDKNRQVWDDAVAARHKNDERLSYKGDSVESGESRTRPAPLSDGVRVCAHPTKHTLLLSTTHTHTRITHSTSTQSNVNKFNRLAQFLHSSDMQVGRLREGACHSRHDRLGALLTIESNFCSLCTELKRSPRGTNEYMCCNVFHATQWRQALFFSSCLL